MKEASFPKERAQESSEILLNQQEYQVKCGDIIYS